MLQNLNHSNEQSGVEEPELFKLDAAFCIQLEASCLQWSFFTYIDNFSLFTYSWSFFAYSCSFFTYNWSFFAYNGKVRLISGLKGL